jgi:hypothetical protein
MEVVEFLISNLCVAIYLGNIKYYPGGIEVPLDIYVCTTYLGKIFEGYESTTSGATWYP